jgi:L-rhamnose mutarotase
MKKKVIKQLAVKVTENDIKKGKKGSYDSCPIALALTRKCNINNYSVFVADKIVIYDGDLQGTYKHSNSSVKFINKFDSRTPVKPARFVFKRQRS